MKLSPADHVIRVFKGVRATARAIGRSPSTVSRWRKPVSKLGTGGEIPGPLMRKIMELAHQQKLDITAEDLVHGRTINERKKPR